MQTIVLVQWSGLDESSIVEKVNQFHTLYPLEDPSSSEEQRMSAVLGVRTMVVKGINAHDGQGYVLRVVDGKQVGSRALIDLTFHDGNKQQHCQHRSICCCVCRTMSLLVLRSSRVQFCRTSTRSKATAAKVQDICTSL
jgi:hypothetical protein